jgi:DNA primase
MAGVQNVVAPQGTAITADHARILKRYVEEVVLCFDSDEAGQNAAVRSLENLLASGLAVRVAVVPSPHDPDSFIKASGGPAFKQLIDSAEGFFDYYLNRLCAINDVTSDKGRLVVLRDMAEAVHKTGNVVLVDKYAQKTALRLGVSPDSVRDEFKHLSRAGAKPYAAPAEAPEEPVEAKAPIQPPSNHEYRLMKLLLMHEDLLGWAEAQLDPNWIQHPIVRQIVSQRLAVHANQSWTGLAGFLAECETPEMQNLITEAATEETLPNPAQDFAGVALRLRNQFIDRQMAALMQRRNQPELSASELSDLSRQQLELVSAKRSPLPKS